jgi:hypothetical protein
MLSTLNLFFQEYTLLIIKATRSMDKFHIKKINFSWKNNIKKTLLTRIL